MSNITAFPKPYRAPPVEDGAPPRAAQAGTFGAVPFLLYVVFLVLLWISRPIRFLFSVAALCLLIAAVLIALGMDAGPQKTQLLCWALGGGLGAFALDWFYGVLLTRLSPEPVAFY